VDRQGSRFERLVTAGGLEVVFAAAMATLSVVLGAATGDPVGILLDVAMYVTAVLTIRWPRAAGAVLVVLLMGYAFAARAWVELGQYAPLLVVLGTGMRGHRRLRTWLSVGFLAVYVALQYEQYPVTTFVLASLVWTTLIALCWLIGTAVNRYQVIQGELRSAALNEQRLQLARGLHDTVARTLSRVALRARQAGAEGDVDALEEIADGVSRAASELRWMLNLLREPDAEAQLAAASGSIAEAVQRADLRLNSQGFQFSSTMEGDPSRVAESVGSVVVLAIEEAVANLERHGSPEAPSGLILSVGEQALDLVIVNQVLRDSPDGTHGLGLVGVRERLLAIGGEFDARREGRQWLMQLRTPLVAGRSG
jgi:signal transduction histidine kinase